MYISHHEKQNTPWQNQNWNTLINFLVGFHHKFAWLLLIVLSFPQTFSIRNALEPPYFCIHDFVCMDTATRQFHFFIKFHKMKLFVELCGILTLVDIVICLLFNRKIIYLPISCMWFLSCFCFRKIILCEIGQIGNGKKQWHVAY